MIATILLAQKNAADSGGGFGMFLPMVLIIVVFYFFMTGLHALHMVIGLGILTVLVIMAYISQKTGVRSMAVGV